MTEPVRLSKPGATVDALLTQIPKINNTNKRSYIVAGVIRYNATLQTWEQISGAHKPLNTTTISCPTDETINIAYPLTGIVNPEVVSFIIAPDEDLSEIGLTCGASVDVASATVKVFAEYRGYILYQNSEWKCFKHTALPAPTMTWSTDHLEVDIPWEMVHYGWTVASPRGYNIKLGAQTNNQFSVYFYNDTNTLVTAPDTSMQFYFDAGRRTVKTRGDAAIKDQYGNLWYMGIIQGDA